jgi:hypothetical protein
MTSLFARLFVDEIGAVLRDGGYAHLRRRVVAFSPEDREALRAALADAPR